ncbi:MAG: MBL fold metallo-hydrolase, partial [Deltaproteobacteria bacterium]
SAAGKNIYISGDTAYFDGFRELGKMFGIDLAIINVGAYEPRWFMQSSHLNPAEAVEAFRELGARYLLIVHWGSFRLGDEPIFLPPIEVKKEMAKAGLAGRLIELSHGQTVYEDQLL